MGKKKAKVARKKGKQSLNMQALTTKFVKQLKKWEPKIEDFKKEALKASKNVRTSFLKNLDEYKEKEKVFLKSLQVYKKSSEGALKDLGEGLKEVSGQLQQTFKKMSEHFKKA